MIYMETKLKVLFLDDEENRHVLVKRWLPDAACCYSYKECVDLLTEQHFDVVSLDHDLADSKHTGVDVAKFIVGQELKPNIAIIHSYNLPGAETMASILSAANVKALRIPFGFRPNIYTGLRAC